MTEQPKTLNPFIINSDFHLKVLTVYTSNTESKGASIVRTTTEILVEEQKHIKIYKTGNNLQSTTFMFSMNKFARDIYLWMQCNIGEDQDTIVLDMDKICDTVGIGKDSYYKGIEDLKINCFITPYKKNKYWINPYILFRGDRIAYYREQCPDCIKNVTNVYREHITNKENVPQ